MDPEKAPPCTGVLWPFRLRRGRASKVAVAVPGMPFGEQTATHLSRVGRRADSALDFRRVAVVPDRSWVHRPSRGQGESGSDRPQLGLGDLELRAPAHATQLACRSLRRRESQPCSRPPLARGSREPPRGSDPAAEGARGCEGPGRVPSSPCPVRVGSAERNGAGRSAARAVPSLSERPPWRRGAVTQA